MTIDAAGQTAGNMARVEGDRLMVGGKPFSGGVSIVETPASGFIAARWRAG